MKPINVLLQIVLIFACLFVGEAIVFLTRIAFPSSLIGMFLLLFLLKMGWIKKDWVKETSQFLLRYMGLFFVPPGVALMLYFDIIAASFFPICIATLASILLVMLATGWTYQLLQKKS